MKDLFVNGAWLYTLEEEMSEKDFIRIAGGLQEIEPYLKYSYLSLVIDDPEEPKLIGHSSGESVAIVMASRGHKEWQTMEIKD